MATGTITTVNPDKISGTITLDDDGGTYGFSDTNFPSTGLAPTNPATTAIDFEEPTPIGTGVEPVIIEPPVEITTTVTQDFTVGKGQSLVVRNKGHVKGNVVIGSGSLTVQGGGLVEGNITVSDGGNVNLRNNGHVKGNVVIGSGNVMKIVGGGKLEGSLTITKSNKLIIGNDNGGGIITGTIDIKKIRRVEITSTSKFNCP
jgi:hypothetical protein